MKVVIKGHQVSLDEKLVLGTGGEATVTRWKNQAVKIYHPDMQSAMRQHKLQAAIKLGTKLPPELIWPKTLVTNPQGIIIGFTMNLVDPAAEPIALLGKSRRYRQQQNIHTRDVLEVFLQAQKTLTQLHPLGIVVGDLNGRNELTLGTQIFWIDTDSYQFAGFPCPVGSIDYIDPLLYGRDLSQGIHFSPATDWYSYAILFFRSLLLIHPFHGRHPQLKTPEKRAQAKVDVLSADVTYPTAAYRPGILSDQMLETFIDYFRNGRRQPFSQDLIEQAITETVECPKCHVWYHGLRSQCPECQQQNLVIVQRQQARTDGIYADEIFQTKGNIVATSVNDFVINCLTLEADGIYLHSITTPKAPQKFRLGQFSTRTRFSLSQNWLITSNPSDLGQISLWDISKLPSLTPQTLSTDCFAQKTPIFGASQKYTYRLVKGQLLRGSKRMNLYNEIVLARFAEDQTWFTVSPVTYPEGDIIVGFWRVWNSHHWFLISDTSLHQLNLPTLESGESLLDATVCCSRQTAVIIRRTEQKGREYVRIEQVDRRGRALLSRRQTIADNPPYDTLRGKIHSGQFLLTATDQGIVRENLSTRLETIFSASAPYSKKLDRLYTFRKGIVVAKEQSLWALTLA